MGRTKKKKTDGRRRIRLPFWLDLNKPMEAEIADEVADLKNNRRFAATVRDAMRLILSLRAGRLDILEELFPMIIAKIEARMLPDPDDLNSKIDEIKRLIEQGRIIPMFDNPDDSVLLKGGAKPSGLKPLGGMKPMIARQDDDDEDTIVVKKSTDTSAGMNFLASMAALNQ